jgi:hypothetical protein
VHGGRILQDDDFGPLRPAEAQLGDGGSAILEQALFVCRIDPGTRHDFGPIEWPNILLIRPDYGVNHVRGEQTFFDQ